MASQITSAPILCSTFFSDADQRKHPSSASLAFVRGNPPVTGGFHSQKASNVENASIRWRHHVLPVQVVSNTFVVPFSGSHRHLSATPNMSTLFIMGVEFPEAPGWCHFCVCKSWAPTKCEWDMKHTNIISIISKKTEQINKPKKLIK